MLKAHVAAGFSPASGQPSQAQRAALLQRLVVLACLGLAVVATTAQTKKEPPSEPLDLNTVTVEQLEKLPGIGPATAKAIVRFREKSGPFRRVEELLAIRGITKKRLEAIRPYVTVKPKLENGKGKIEKQEPAAAKTPKT